MSIIQSYLNIFALFLPILMTGKWNDADCVNRFGYICKKREGPQPPPTLPTEVKGVCPDGFKSERKLEVCLFVCLVS